VPIVFILAKRKAVGDLITVSKYFYRENYYVLMVVLMYWRKNNEIQWH